MGKKIVICSDGTWNKFEDGSLKNTNVGRLYDALEVIPGEQIKFYDPGIGTGMGKLIGGATGWGISQNIKDCYGYLVDNYAEGDSIFLFGFSRGAYTVRSLAGLVHRCGILKESEKNKIDEAYDCYRKIDFDALQAIKNKAAVRVNIHMIGVWDTVGALGIPVNWLNRFNPLFHEFHDTQLDPYVKFAYQALAIDESRKNFSPTLWEGQPAPGQTVEQVWFAGVHSDVGGGYPERELADISYKWMLSKAIQQGLKFKPGYESAIKPNPYGFLHDSRAGAGKIYFKKVRVVPQSKKSTLSKTVPERMAHKQNIPAPEYRPENLCELAQLPDQYRLG